MEMYNDICWHPTKEGIWNGRDDTSESPDAKRLFQTVEVLKSKDRIPTSPKSIALLGFACDVGVARNGGRIGAASAPDQIRRTLANMAAHSPNHSDITDYGNLVVYPSFEHEVIDIDCASSDKSNQVLEDAQTMFEKEIRLLQSQGKRTFVFGGGHETAYPHGLGVYQAHPNKTVGIINFDAHLDIRSQPRASSGTSFRNLYHYCKSQSRHFNYMVVGASLTSNTASLVKDAGQMGVEIIWDTDFFDDEDGQTTINIKSTTSIKDRIQQFVNRCDIIYLTIDLDVLPQYQMPGVSAPAALGVSLERMLPLLTMIARNNNIYAMDLVEFNPKFDIQNISAKTAARIAWSLLQNWNLKCK